MGIALASWTEFASKHRRALPWASWLALFALQWSAFHAVRSDDAYITYRYGQNLAEGFGLVFNPDQRVQGSTSPAHMLIAALIYACVGLAATPDWMAAVGCAAWSAQAIAVFRLLAPAIGPLAAAFVGFAIGLGMSGAAAWLPLETNLVAALALFASAFARERRWVGAAITAGFAVFVRPDAALVAALVLGACLLELRARAIAPLALFAGVALPWPLFATFYYGSPLPQTALTKFQRSDFVGYLMHEISHVAERFVSPAQGPLWGALAWLLALLGARRLVRCDRRLALFVGYGLLHAAAYLVLRPFTQHTWHLYPWTLVFCVCGLSAIVPVPHATHAARLGKIQIALTALLAVWIGMRFVRDSDRLASGYWTGQRDATYREIARWLDQHASRSDWFASIEVGTIAYYSRLPAFDLGGLVTRADDSLADHPVRYVVVDRLYRPSAPPKPPVFSAHSGSFWADVYEPRAPGP